MSIFFLLFIVFTPCIADAQLMDNFHYDEISVTLNVPRVGSLEIPAVMHGMVVYLPIKEIFDFLRIRNIPSADLDSVSGFFINPLSKYLIDKTRNRIEYEDKVFELKPGDLVRTETGLYMKSDYFLEVFGLDCNFSFRTLSVTLNTKIELPAIREMQQELMRENISRLKGEKKADTIIKRSFPIFRLGMADWGINATQQTNGISNTRLNLGLGAIVAGGETNISLNYNIAQPFNKAQQYYNWRFVNNDNAALRQVSAGKVFAQSISTIYAPVTGVQFTNTPTTYRKSFGTYRLSDKTEPGWTVELYVNNVLVNYMKADASGFFTFEVPLVYGNSVIKLRIYGPWGEEQIKEQYISLPFNFLPLHEFEYTATAGIVADDQKSKYARANFNYGLGTHITIGGGMEYLSSVTSGETMPFINASMRLGSKLLITGEHVYGVRSKAIISYRLPSDLQFDLNYTKYDKLQTAIKFNYLEERKLVISKPFHGSNYAFFTRLTLNQFNLPNSKYSTAEFLVSGIISGISSNLTTTAFINNQSPYIYSNLSLTFRLPAGIRFTPQAQYDFRQKNFSMLRGEVQKQIFNRGFVNLSYQKGIINKSSLFGIGIRYNFSFAQTSFYATQSNHNIATNQSASGSFMYDAKTNYLGAKSQPSVGKGGIIISPFLDLNCNGRRDADEPKLIGLNLRVNGGRIEHSNRDTTIRISQLEAYNNYLIELDKNSFDNIAWQIKKPTIQITIEPNHFKFIEVPVAVVGEVSGTVYLNNKKEQKGLGRIIINIYDSSSNLAGRTLSESDGYFSYMGLAPGVYIARIDTAQLRNLQMTSSSALSFTILPNKDGDMVDTLKFVVVGMAPSLHSTIPIDKKNTKISNTALVQTNAAVVEKETGRQAAKQAQQKVEIFHKRGRKELSKKNFAQKAPQGTIVDTLRLKPPEPTNRNSIKENSSKYGLVAATKSVRQKQIAPKKANGKNLNGKAENAVAVKKGLTDSKRITTTSTKELQHSSGTANNNSLRTISKIAKAGKNNVFKKEDRVSLGKGSSGAKRLLKSQLHTPLAWPSETRLYQKGKDLKRGNNSVNKKKGIHEKSMISKVGRQSGTFNKPSADIEDIFIGNVIKSMQEAIEKMKEVLQAIINERETLPGKKNN